ncbi:MAG: hypothetical protein H0W42_04150 [Gemmatimonadaceae bacterium]|nr:hypothetical protein [Gemmatimonadaceae bacterium]
MRGTMAGSMAFLLAVSTADAQRPGAATAVDSAMAPLGWLVGEWEGTETGEYSTDGSAWRKFFEMRLRRVAPASQ